MLDTTTIRQDFPVFKHYPKLAYLDNAATTQKPKAVIDGIVRYYTTANANIHRGIYHLATQATQQYEQARKKVQTYINAPASESIIFTKGTTEGINLVVQSFLLPRLEAGDEVVISAMEHHANLIPWQMACHQKKAQLRIIPMNDDGELDLLAYRNLLSRKTKMVALTHISNTLGTINPIETMIDLAHQREIPVLIDAAQSLAHYAIDVQALDADFLVGSGHKIFAPTGIGLLYGKTEHLEQMPPYQFGGAMIKTVTFEQTTFAKLPNKFEAGTPNIAGAIGLGNAIDYINQLDKPTIQAHLKHLRDYATEQLQAINQLKIIGKATQKSAIISFVLGDIHPHDIATFLDQDQIAVRVGQHCTQPIMARFNIPGTSRVSFSIYNTTNEIDRLVATLSELQVFFL